MLAFLIPARGAADEQDRQEITDFEKRAGRAHGNEQVDLLIEFAGQQRGLDRHQQALETARNALREAERLGYKRGAADALASIGVTYWRAGDYQLAIDHQRRALEKREVLGDRPGMAASLNTIGLAHWGRGEYEEALVAHERALEIRRQLGDERGVAHSLNNIGAVNRSLGRYDLALEHYQEALGVRNRLGDRKDVAGSLNNIGIVYKELENYSKALEFHSRALEIKRSLKDDRAIANSLNNIGITLLEKGEPAAALEQLGEALRLYELIEDRAGRADALLYIGQCHLDLGALDRARQSYDLALTVARGIGDRETIMEAHRQLARAFAAGGDHEAALAEHMRYAEVKDQLLSEDSRRRLDEMRVRYETTRKEQEIALLQKTAELRKVRLRNEQLIRYALITGLLLIIVFGAVFARRYAHLFAFWKKHKHVGKYRLLEQIGAGGMGSVYRAHSIMDRTKTYAIKLLREELFDDERSRERFQREADLIDGLDHPNIIQIFDRGQRGNQLFIAMELLEGETLEQRTERGEIFTTEEIAGIAVQIADALSAVHRSGIVHRDLTPGNVMLIERGGSSCFVKLMDFGLAKAGQRRLTDTGILVGTIHYMSPEQFSGEGVTVASDVFSMGVLLYEICLLAKPFDGETVTDVMRSIIGDEPGDLAQLAPDLPRRLSELIARMLAKRPDERPSTGEVHRVLMGIRASIEDGVERIEQSAGGIDD